MAADLAQLANKTLIRLRLLLVLALQFHVNDAHFK